MAAPEVTLTDPKKFQVDETVEALEGETHVIVNLPTAVPAGKKAVIQLRVRAKLVDAT